MIHLITAIIRPHCLDAVRAALAEHGVTGITVTEVRGVGRQKGHTERYRGTEYRIDFVPKLRIEILAPTDAAESVAKVIADAARTGQIGDGKVWLQAMDRTTRIRTRERGEEAL